MATTITGTTIDVGTNVIVTDSAGKVGIGTASPARALEVYSTQPAIKLNNGTNAFTIGTGAFVDGSNSLVIYDEGVGERMRIDAAGIVTKPYQPAFQAVPSAAQTNIIVGNTTVVFGTEVFDIGSNFASNTFTAPVTGKYQLQLMLRFDDIDTGANYYQTRIVTSNRSYEITQALNRFSADVQYWNMPTMSVVADMDAGDTAYCQVTQPNGTVQTDIAGGITVFSGILAA